MAGNKHNPTYKPYKPYMYTLTYVNEYKAQETVQGTANQVIKHILNQQTV